MSRIAILDSEIEPKGLHCSKFESYHICKKEYTAIDSEASHGTKCARVLDKFADDYELTGIQILTENGIGKPMGNIEHLKEGLELCYELDVDIVCMSAVSSILSDSRHLFSVVQQLANKSVIISALDNERYITIPASYPFVLGVQSDRKEYLMQGEVAYQRGNLFGAEIYANCNMELLKKMHCSPSNSFAVPVAAADINNWLNQKKDITEYLHQLKSYPIPYDKNNFQSGTSMVRQDIPLIVIYSLDEKDIFTVCRDIMNILYDRYQVQTSALSSADTEYDIRFRKIDDSKCLLEALLFMEKHYKTDLIFVIVSEKERDEMKRQVDFDMEIAVDGMKCDVILENRYVESKTKKLADLLVELL